MEKLLKAFLDDSSSRGIIFKKEEILEIKRLSKEKNKNFYEKFNILYDKFYKSLIVPTDAYSFYIEEGEIGDLNVIFFNNFGEQIATLKFKNSEKKILGKFIFKQLVGNYKVYSRNKLEEKNV